MTDLAILSLTISQFTKKVTELINILNKEYGTTEADADLLKRMKRQGIPTPGKKL
jgi:hypothetical protein